jgi:1,4-dihydroxy-6-naphthoate synthase
VLNETLTIAYTPDSDDAFYYFALETGRLSLPGKKPRFHRLPLSVLNRSARLGIYHVTAVSSVLYPQIAGQYAILSAGTSVGRNYGPVLVSRRPLALEELRGGRVGVAGVPTTGWFLLRCLCPDAVVVQMPYDAIGAAVATGALDAGVMIHEELLYYPQLGLHRVVDLGAAWCQRYGVPLPVGLNVVRRDLGAVGMRAVCAAIQESLLYAHRHQEEALDWVSRFGRGAEGQCTESFVEMFANDDSLRMPDDVREGLRVLLCQVVDEGLGAAVPPLDIIEGVGSGLPSRAVGRS